MSDPEHVSSVVVFYGTRPGDYGGARAVYQGHFAEEDEFEPTGDVNALEEVPAERGASGEFLPLSWDGTLVL